MKNDLKIIIETLRTDPVKVNKALWPNEPSWAGQEEIIRAVWEHKYVCVKACNGSGKSHTAARLVTDFLFAWPNAKIISTAQTWSQVKDVLWDEINRQYALSKFPLGGKLTECRWEIAPSWWAVGISTNEAGAFLGRHEDHILVLMDEACGVPSEMDAAAKSLITSANSKYVKISNPVEASGHYFDNFGSDIWHKITISAFDTPNFTTFGITEADIFNNTWQAKITGPIPYPRLVTPAWVWERMQEYGADSGWYQCFVKGEFPSQSADSLISLTWCINAVRRVEVNPDGKRALGVDVAYSPQGDESVICLYDNGKVEILDAQYGQDEMRTTGKTKLYAEQYKCPAGIDDIGVGHGVITRLKELKVEKVYSFWALDKSVKYGKFANRTSAAWWAIRDALKNGTIIIPNDNKLIAQLTGRKYHIASDGQIEVESKELMKKRGLSSPDRADALTIAYTTAQWHGLEDKPKQKLTAKERDAIRTKQIADEAFEEG
jgi:hypothetical protein